MSACDSFEMCIRDKDINELTKILYDGLKDIDGIKFYSNINLKHVPIISFNIKDIPANYIAMKLWDDYEICVRAGSHCAPLFHEKMGTKKQGIVRMLSLIHIFLFSISFSTFGAILLSP